MLARLFVSSWGKDKTLLKPMSAGLRRIDEAPTDGDSIGVVTTVLTGRRRRVNAFAVGAAVTCVGVVSMVLRWTVQRIHWGCGGRGMTG